MNRGGRAIWLGVAACLVAVAAAFIPVGGGEVRAVGSGARGAEAGSMELSKFSAEPPAQPLRALFIHHSCGGQLLAPNGPARGESCIYESHPNGGDLRGQLRAAGYEVHEASYDSVIGANTTLFDWAPKFRDGMDLVLATDHQDRRYTDGRKNQVVVFKSCFTESWFVGEGEPTGRPQGPELTLSNAKATLSQVRDVLARQPDVLFVYVTAPPLAPWVGREPLWKWAAKRVMGKRSARQSLETAGVLARRFNEWVTASDGWLAGYPQRNLVVFDYYGILTEADEGGLSRYASGEGTDSHPSAAGNARAAREFVPFLNRAARRAGLAEPAPVPDAALRAAQ